MNQEAQLITIVFIRLNSWRAALLPRWRIRRLLHPSPANPGWLLSGRDATGFPDRRAWQLFNELQRDREFMFAELAAKERAQLLDRERLGIRAQLNESLGSFA